MANEIARLRKHIADIEKTFEEIRQVADEREKKMLEKGEINPVEAENIRMVRDGLAKNEEEIQKFKASLPPWNSL